MNNHLRRFCKVAACCFFLTALIVPAVSQEKEKKKGQDDKVEGVTNVTVNIPTVTLNATVTDKDGNLVTGLTKEYFKVYEDGKLQEITNFFRDESPVNIVLLMESSNLITGIEQDFWYATLDFIKNLRKDDYCALVTYDMKPHIAVDFTQDKGKIINEANISLYFKGFSESCLSDAVVFVLQRMQDVHGKKAVVLLSTGLDTFSRTTYTKALGIAGESDTVLYAISMGQLIRTLNDDAYSSLTRSEFLMADLRLKSFAKRTGGYAMFPRFSSEYPSIFRNLNMYLRYQYTLAYQPTNQKLDGKTRKIKVEAMADIDHDGKMNELKVSCKDSYKPEPNK
jgi:Ca-activated chloride channel family protein